PERRWQHPAAGDGHPHAQRLGGAAGPARGGRGDGGFGARCEAGRLAHLPPGLRDRRRPRDGARSTDVQPLRALLRSRVAAGGGPRQLSVRDTVRARVGNAAFTVDYGRPLARGRVLLGNVIPYERVWRTGANAATQFTTSAPITIAGLAVPAGTYTLWTLPHA